MLVFMLYLGGRVADFVKVLVLLVEIEPDPVRVPATAPTKNGSGKSPCTKCGSQVTSGRPANIES